ncbi:MAG TPA: hypothetical protein VFW11_11455 [Cyclobacteriaceae bacterium]|nr:hypothetical protein [Cyclobacteriaceae bacterium]
MAKVDSIIKFSGTLDKLTFVRSAAYGDHVRRKRGSVKPARVNEAFKRSSDELKMATPYAKLIKDSVNPFLSNCRDWTLWSRLRSFFRKQVRSGSIDYYELVGFEFHKKHTLDSLLRGRPAIDASINGSELCISFQLQAPPHIPLSYIDGYQLTLVVIGVNGESTSSCTGEYPLGLARLNEKPGIEQLRLSLKEPADTIILALKCEGCKGNNVMNNAKSQGMAIVHVLKWPKDKG